jgi:hypothetical protein
MTRTIRFSLFALVLLTAALVCLRPAGSVAISRAAMPPASGLADGSRPLPNLQGAAALAHLQQQGLYDSLGAALTAARYRVRAQPERAGEFAAANPAQQLHAEFTAAGLALRASRNEHTQRVGLQLRGAGYGQRLLAVTPGQVSAQAERVEIRRSVVSVPPSADLPPVNIVEWYVNHPAGLEQGFTLSAAPGGAAASGERLTLALAVTGELRARVEAAGQALEFVDGAGQTALRYDHLVVTDAAGRTLPARMAVAGDELRLEVQDEGAIYPVTIDPTFAQQAYLKAHNAGAEDQFGSAVAISGDTIVIGAPYEDGYSNGATNAGAAYVFVRSGATWSQQAYLNSPNTGAGDEFGSAVAISGDTIVVGVTKEDSNATGVNGNYFDNSAPESGAAYVFVRSGIIWGYQAYLKASNTEANDNFGKAVAISGDTLIVGAHNESSSATGVNGNQADNSSSAAGAAYVFVRSGAAWSQQAYLKASNTGAYDFFGSAVAISGDTVVVGAYAEDSNATGINGNQADNSVPNAGAAYIFVRSSTTWSQQAYLKASNTGRDEFGSAVAISGDTIVVGAPLEDSSATGVNGNQADNSAIDPGAAYVFVRSGAVWSQQAYLKASNTEVTGFFALGDEFGKAVAISGDTIVVGARRESSNANGVDGDQNDNSALQAGAAYVFVRSSATWSQRAYLKASISDGYDQFGSAVAISSDTILVGAPSEDSSGPGSEIDNSANNAGAAYVFTRTVSLSKTSQSFAANGGGDSFMVTTTNAWTAVSNNPDFITVTAPVESVNGADNVSYTVANHTGTNRRSGTITVAGETFTIQQGAMFNDVTESHPFYTEISKLSAAGVTQGCGSGNFCSDAFVTREQMAAFLSRALGAFNPPSPAAQRFNDVLPDNPFYAFIEEIAARGITLGCGGGNYCPSATVTREQMAAFIIRALHAPGYMPPPPATQRFADVPSSNPFYAHIEELALRGITLGCGAGNYCPQAFVTRAQMAAFLARAFAL